MLQLAEDCTGQALLDDAVAEIPHYCPLRAESAVHRLFRAMAQYDPATAAHSVRVRWYALWIADELGLDPQQVRQLGAAALLHDIGKLCLPRKMLHKPGPLTTSEWARMRGHSIIGERLLRATVPCPAVAAAVRSHHELVDGRGYPDRLAGSEIPVLAQVLSVADAYDAMTSARSYAITLSGEGALAVLRDEAGRHFDSGVVAHFAATLAKPWARGVAR